MRILVTGGLGFIGSNLVEKLLAYKHDISILDNESTGNYKNLPSKINNVKIDIGDILDINQEPKKYDTLDAIVHLAAPVSVTESMKNPAKYREQIFDGTTEVLDAALTTCAKRVIIASTAAVYGNTTELPVKETNSLKPESPYAKEKLASEEDAKKYVRLGLEPVILRFFNVYGPKQDAASPYSGVITKFIDNARAGKHITIYGDGAQTRDFVHVQDVVQAIYNAVTSKTVKPGEVINIGSGISHDINYVASEILKLSNKKLQILHELPRNGEVKDSKADISKARALIDYNPKVRLNDGLKRLWKYSMRF